VCCFVSPFVMPSFIWRFHVLIFSLLVWFFFSAKDSSSADVAGWPSYISSNPHHVNHDLIGFFQVLRQPVGLFFFD
jgi:hypothetical protein